MVGTWYRCRKCRAYLFSNEHLAIEKDECDFQEETELEDIGPTEMASSTVVVSKDEDHKHVQVTCCVDSLYFLKLEGCPVWIVRLLEKGKFLKGKLNCPNCSGRVGSFDFFCKSTCECGNHTTQPIHVAKNRIDESKTNAAVNIRMPNIPKSQRPEFQIVKTMEEAGLLTGDTVQVDADKAKGSLNVENNTSPVTISKAQKDHAPYIHAKRPYKKYLSPGGDSEPAELMNEDKSNSSRINERLSNKYSPLEVPEMLHMDDDDVLCSDVDEYTCPICLDVFYHPYTCKPCKHTFCGPCLRRLAGANAQSTKCPLCRKPIDACLPNYEMTKNVRKTHPQEWLLRHNIERKVRKKLPSLPGNGLSRRRVKQTASEILNQSAGVVFVALFVMFCVTIIVTILSFALLYVLERFGDLIVNLVNDVHNVLDSIWNVLLVHFFEGRISSDASRTFIQTLTSLSSSLSKIYNRTGIS